MVEHQLVSHAESHLVGIVGKYYSMGTAIAIIVTEFS